MSKIVSKLSNEAKARHQGTQWNIVSADAGQLRKVTRLIHGEESVTCQIKSESKGCEVFPKIIHETISSCKQEPITASAAGSTNGMIPEVSK